MTAYIIQESCTCPGTLDLISCSCFVSLFLTKECSSPQPFLCLLPGKQKLFLETPKHTALVRITDACSYSCPVTAREVRESSSHQWIRKPELACVSVSPSPVASQSGTYPRRPCSIFVLHFTRTRQTISQVVIVSRAHQDLDS